MRAALYARVSSRRQGDNFSIEAQLTAMQQYAEETGYRNALAFAEQGSAWRDGLERSKLNEVLGLARRGQLDAVIFFSMDRFTRDMGDGIILRRELYRLGVKLICYYPQPHEVASDNELVHILEDWRSQQFVENLRAAVKGGYARKAAAGLYTVGRAPYGYRIVGRKYETRLEVVAECVAVVLQIFRWYITGWSVGRIAKELTSMRIPTPGEVSQVPYKRRKRPAGHWSPTAVYRIVHDESYAGVWYAFRFGMDGKRAVRQTDKRGWVPVPVPPIVDPETWAAAQVRHAEHDGGRRAKYDYLMSRRLRCTCGYAVCANSGKVGEGERRLYYACTAYKHFPHEPCGLPNFRAGQVDAVVWAWVKELLDDPERLMEGYQDAQAQLNARQRELAAQRDLAAEQLSAYEQQLSGVIDMRTKTNSRVVQQQLDRQADELGQIVEGLMAKVGELDLRLQQETITDAHIAGVAAFVGEIREELTDIEAMDDFASRRRIVELLDVRATLRLDANGGKWVDVHWLVQAQAVRIPAQRTCSS